MDADRTKRRDIFTALARLFGRILPASFIQKPNLPEVERIHPLIEGIYKPAWSRYALSIASMLQSQYHDQTHFNPDATWWMHYSPKSGGMEMAQNAALVCCMTDHEPLLVLKQESDKTSRKGSRYRFLGLGLVESLDVEQKFFRLRGVAADCFTDYLQVPLQDELIETALRLESLEDWQPFIKEDRVLYRVNAQRRDCAFRDVVLENYDGTCAVTGQKFVYASAVEADAAHIIGKGVLGTDDPRNGIALSKSLHWAFDNGLFTISDQYEVILHPEVQRASTKAFPLIQKDRHQIILPEDSAYRPHPEALEWHRKERYGLFAKS
jgi:putative restriction endonuclease